MHIVFGDEVATELRKKYTVLELDTIPHPTRGPTPAYCVLSVEKIVMEMASLEQNISLHEQVIGGIKKNDTKFTRELCELMKGKFGGEMDTFYEEVVKRIDETNCTFLVLPQEIS